LHEARTLGYAPAPMKTSLATLLLLAAAPSFAEAPAKAAEKPATPAAAPAIVAGTPGQKVAESTGVVVRGEKLKGLPNVKLAELLKAPAPHEGKTVAVEGTVRKTCSGKGCWMELATGEKGPGVRVTFKDYGFFVPLDSSGKTARVEGLVKVAELSEDTAKHFEGEGAIVPRGADGKPREVQLIASAVELLPAGAAKPTPTR
jgi:hypothetical protein